MDSLPLLHLEERAWVEKIVGRKLSDQEAQILLRQARVAASVNRWLEERVKP